MGSGKTTNNQAESLALFQGLRITDNREHRRVIVIGDLELIIRSMRQNFGHKHSVNKNISQDKQRSGKV